MPAYPLHTASRASDAPKLNAADRAAAAAGSGHGGERGGHLSVTGLSKGYGDRRVLSDVSFTAADGDRIGLIGENGTGKSTLLRILATVEAPDAGRVELPAVQAPTVVDLLAQELTYPEATPIRRVLDDAQRGSADALRAIESASARLAADPDAPRAADDYAAALESAERLDAWSAEARRGDVVAGLGLGGVAEDRPVGTLSGGQRLRLSLAAILLRAPYLLLLDEPSNHLDDASAAYLERVLREWRGIVVVASHDRSLLDAVTTRIIDIDPLPVPAGVLAEAAGVEPRGPEGEEDPVPGEEGESPDTGDTGSGLGVRVWGMGYTAAREARAAELTRWRDRYARECEEHDALVHEIEIGSREVNKKHESKSEAKITRKFYADKDARVTARRARNARVRLETLERDRIRRPPVPLRFAGITPTRGAARGPAPAGAAPGAALEDVVSQTPSVEQATAAPLVAARRIGLAHRLAPTSLEIAPGGRLLLTGPNGAGKSTLLSILADELDADAGEIERDPRASVGYLPQEVEFARPDLVAAEAYRGLVGSPLADDRPLESLGLLAVRDASRPVGSLSVGQRRRIALAALVADPPDLLLLDEPTNHLSLTLVEDLEAALAEYSGAVIVATHDRWWRSRWTGEVLPLGGGVS